MKARIITSLAAVSLTLFASCGEKPKEKKEPPKIVRLASGLSYEVLQKGSGVLSPQQGQKVIVHYTGWLEEDGKPGKKFDSSIDRNKKFAFNIGIGQVIKGWDEGVMGMTAGEKRRLVVPHQLAYGKHGIPGVIPGKATLIFDVELFDLE